MEIRVEHAGKTIKGVTILEDITISMKSGMVYGLHGENGSGKTMLMRLISGLIKPTTGKIKINGKSIGKGRDFPISMGLLLENPAFLDGYTGIVNLTLLANLRGNIGKKQIVSSLLRVGLDPNDKRKYKKFSLGMKQKLGIAAAVMEKPELLILDEPFNALDKESAKRVKQIIIEEKERGALILLTCHDEKMLRNLSDKIFFIENGRVKE